MNNKALVAPVRVRHHVLLLNNLQPTPRRKKLERFASAEDMVSKLRPSEPVHCLRPHVIEQAAKWFLANFPGEVMYSVKSNPDPRVLATLAKAGIKHFDVASLAEVALVAQHFPRARQHFMHPVKSREAIWQAYHQYNVRHFVLDSFEELEKILQVTERAQDLCLTVRLAIPNDHAAYSLAGKFGIGLDGAAELLKATRNVAKELGIAFHVGSQCMEPDAYAKALAMVKHLLDTTGVALDLLDVGGGFPSIYPGLTPPAMGAYTDAIRAALEGLGLPKGCKMFCEPGRALVAEGGALVVRVELRKGERLYINDGTYGSLFDAGHPGFVFPARAIRTGGKFAGGQEAFSLFGPTCDSLDAMKGPFLLPPDIREGDWIEVGQLGAYGQALRTRFNGFHSDAVVEVADRPILSALGVN